MSPTTIASVGSGVASLAGGLFGDTDTPRISATLVDPVKELLNAFGYNEDNFSRFAQLSSKANKSNVKQIQDTLTEFGFNPMRDRLTKAFNDELDGQVLTQQDVDLIREQSGVKAFGSGIQGSGASVNQFAKELSLTTAQLRERKLNNAVRVYESLYQTTPIPQPVATQNMFFSPGQALQVADANANRKQQADMFNATGEAGDIIRNNDNFWAGIGGFFGSMQGIGATGGQTSQGSSLSSILAMLSG